MPLIWQYRPLSLKSEKLLDEMVLQGFETCSMPTASKILTGNVNGGGSKARDILNRIQRHLESYSTVSNRVI